MGNPAPTMIETPKPAIDTSAVADQARFVKLATIGVKGNQDFQDPEAQALAIKLDDAKNLDDVRVIIDAHVWPPVSPTPVIANEQG